MHVEFIAHAGVCIKTQKATLLIDPWFTDSTVDRPIIKEIVGHSTIDFQIPKTTKKPSDYQPDAILLSHFHAHHAPLNDILALLSQKDVLIGHPALDAAKNAAAQSIFSMFPRVDLRGVGDGDRVSLQNVEVAAYTHTSPQHMAWQVTSKEGSVLHIADPRFNEKHSVRKLGDAWSKFKNMRPDILFINAGGNSLRKETAEGRKIFDSSAVSPAEAAEIVAYINPKVVSLIGCYNHSVWKNRQEYIRPAPMIEDEFYWAVSWLAPKTKCIFVKPGHTFALHDTSLAGTADTFIPL